MFQWSFRWVSSEFHGYTNEGYVRGISNGSQGNSKSVSTKFLECFEEVSRVFQGGLKDVAMEF